MKLSTPYLKKVKRPTKRGECINGLRPCPWVGCKYHLLWESKHIRENFKTLTDDELADYVFKMDESCALDVSDSGQTLQFIADIMELSKERVRQIAYWRTMHTGALAKLLREREFRLLLRGYFGCEIKTSESS